MVVEATQKELRVINGVKKITVHLSTFKLIKIKVYVDEKIHDKRVVKIFVNYDQKVIEKVVIIKLKKVKVD